MSTAIQFTLEQYDRMIQSGVLDDDHDRRVELVYGEIREMTPPGPTHEEVIDLLTDWSVRNTSRKQVRIRIQNSIGIPELDRRRSPMSPGSSKRAIATSVPPLTMCCW